MERLQCDRRAGRETPATGARRSRVTVAETERGVSRTGSPSSCLVSLHRPCPQHDPCCQDQCRGSDVRTTHEVVEQKRDEGDRRHDDRPQSQAHHGALPRPSLEWAPSLETRANVAECFPTPRHAQDRDGFAEGVGLGFDTQTPEDPPDLNDARHPATLDLEALARGFDGDGIVAHDDDKREQPPPQRTVAHPPHAR